MSNKQNHKRWCKQFNEDCLKRDKNKCVFCGEDTDLDVHHITDRYDLPNGGYVMSNGITVCEYHHLMCEEHHATGHAIKGFHPTDLYEKIGTKHLFQSRFVVWNIC
jgi:hypothetical protein